MSDPREYLDLALDGSDGELSTDPLVAVCAHGKHDQCCAVRGRSATAAIAAQYPELTWECSHLGGDRFAAAMLVLPEGCATDESTQPIRPNSYVCISTGGWTTDSSEDALPFTRCPGCAILRA